ncbi:MAG: M14 family zinc carboxypeptidase [Flavobacteriales bacterium]
MKNHYLTAAILVVFGLTSIKAQDARLKVYLDPISVQLMQEHGMELDHGQIKKGHYIINDFTAQERAWLKQAGVPFDVMIDNVSEYYVERNNIEAEIRESRSACGSENNETFETPSNWGLGSMGGFYTYDEYLGHLDSMVSKFPNLITTRAVIDTFETHQDRPIYWVKISDNPNTNEAEPEVLYTALHHAREPQSLTQLIFYMWYILENYGSDDEVTHLVNNTEMFFVPMINPDGYIQNQTTDPNGGGLWRKNMRDNSNGSFGVDLNRNYGHNWGYDNDGSSPNSNSETYRGPAAFSEPETRAIKWFCEQHEFELALNYHTSGNYLIYPWGHVPSPLTPDSNYFISIAQLLTAQNNYTYGTGFETVAYATNGDSDDWMYGEQGTKNKIFSMTPEVGNGASDGFWPQQSRILPLSQENVRPNLLLSHFAGDYARMVDKSPKILSSTSGSIAIDLIRYGQQFTPDYEFSLEPVTSNVTITGGVETYSNMDILQVYDQSFVYDLDAGIQPGDAVVFDMVAKFNGYESREQITKIYGQPTVALSQSEFDTAEFVSDTWGSTTEDFVSAPSSITDSPFDFYDNVSVSQIEYKRKIDLRQSITAYLTFQAKWQTEAGYDYCQILASPVDENSWTPLCGLYTTEGKPDQDYGQPVWDGNQNTWVREEVSLNDFIGDIVKIKIRLVSDPFVNYDGFYFDDLEFITLIDPLSEVPLDTGYVGEVGIGELELEWQLFPNPASDHLMFSSTNAGGASVHVYNLQGNIVKSAAIRSGSSIDVSDLPSGYYIVQLKVGDSTKRTPIVVLH